MKRLLSYSLALGISLLAPAMASANVIINLAGGFLYKSTGTTTADRIPANSTVVLLIDADGDGFGSLSQAITSWTADPDDVVAARFGSSSTVGRFSAQVDISLAGTVGAGDKLMLVWYEKPFSAADTGPGSGVHFGSYRTDALLGGSDYSFNIPTDGIGALNVFSAARASALGLNDGFAENLGVASQNTVAVPEPASLGVMALCGGALLLRRRRARA